MTVRKILVTLEKDPTLHPTNIVLIPPNKSGCVSDDDSANEDDGAKNVNNIGKATLNRKSKLVVHRNQDDDYGNDFDDEKNFEVNCSNTEPCQLGLSKSNQLHINSRRIKRVLEAQENT